MKTGEYEHSVFVESVDAAMQGIKVEEGSGRGLILLAGEDQGDGISQCLRLVGDGQVLATMLAHFIDKNKMLFSMAMVEQQSWSKNDSDE